MQNQNFVGPKGWRQYFFMLALDFLFVVLPPALFFTVLAEWTYICAGCMMLLLVVIVALGRILPSRSHYMRTGADSSTAIRRLISSYRVSVMIVTCLCILGVDFRIFPRRYAKTETYGTSLMDLGVGSFVLANSLVSRQARQGTTLKYKSSLQAITPLILLGFARLVFTKGVDYQVHVGEYGVHWNFFFTLAAVSLLTSIFNIHPRYCGFLGSFILSAYQICLLFGLNEYLTSRERNMNLFSQNKEGIISLFGYWGMYLIGVNLGYYLFFGKNSRKADMNSVQTVQLRVMFFSITFWLLTMLLDKYVENVSRRMCNLAYVTLVLAQNFQVLAILMLSDVLRSNLLVLEGAFDQNLLAAFLLANILTGLINLTIDTLFVSSAMALGVLLLYSMSLTFLVGCAKFLGMKLKFW
ncbi:uncharacterized protein At4g17910 isoform X2 [Nymphaea colorata]|nr:uncharacterized protein At4g17910 isoform X2 [Nymphaea colorata]